MKKLILPLIFLVSLSSCAYVPIEEDFEEIDDFSNTPVVAQIVDYRTTIGDSKFIVDEKNGSKISIEHYEFNDYEATISGKVLVSSKLKTFYKYDDAETLLNKGRNLGMDSYLSFNPELNNAVYSHFYYKNFNKKLWTLSENSFDKIVNFKLEFDIDLSKMEDKNLTEIYITLPVSVSYYKPAIWTPIL